MVDLVLKQHAHNPSFQNAMHNIADSERPRSSQEVKTLPSALNVHPATPQVPK